MEPRDLPIEQFIPHRGAMRLVDRVLQADDQRAEVEARITRDGVFSRDGGMPGWVGIELMAQTVAAWAGVRAWRRGEEVKAGFLLGTRRYTCTVPAFTAGAVLTVRAQAELIDAQGMAVFACSIAHNGVTLADANLSVYQASNEELARWQKP